jgi:copper chaperone
MAEITLKIEGMSCQHCLMAVKKAISSVSGVSASDVEIGSAKVRYDGKKTKPEDIASAVKKAGYKVVEGV